MTVDTLTFAEAVAASLRPHGSVDLKYLTAEFEPFSSAHRPDVVFVPAAGPNRNRIFVIELRVMGRVFRINAQALRDHREFVQSDVSDYLYFALATSEDVLPAEAAALEVAGIHTFDGVDSPEILAGAVLDWSHSAEAPSRGAV